MNDLPGSDNKIIRNAETVFQMCDAGNPNNHANITTNSKK